MDDREMKTTKEIAELWNVTPAYVCRKANQAKKMGYPWPVKAGTWEAPLAEWERIYQMTTKWSRKKKKLGVINEKSVSVPIKKYSATQAVELLNEEIKDPKKKITSRWLSKLGNRSMELGRDWPKVSGKAKIAPLDEWRKIMNDKGLRAWTRK